MPKEPTGTLISKAPGKTTLAAADLEAGRCKQGRKPRAGEASGSSSRRSVTRLSVEQLVRKRAADREAQRAIRQRTREHIRSLEQRIRELSRDDPEEERLLEVLTKKSVELEREIKKLREILEEIESSHIARSAEPRCYLDGIRVLGNPPVTSNDEATHTILSTPVSRSADYPVAINEASPRRLARHVPEISDTSGPSSKDDTTILPPLRSSSGLETDRPIPSSALTYDFRTSIIPQPSTHAWEVPLCYKTPDNPIERILAGVIENQRGLMKMGISGIALAGPRNPSVGMLVAPDHFKYLQIHPVARMLGEMLGKITYRTFVDKLGAFIVMYPVYQWQIAQSYESYANIPSWCIPLLCQRTTRHPVWICAMGFPGLREVLIADQEKYCTPEFQYLFVSCLNMNWPYGLREALIWDGKDIKFRKEFWDHARVLENWSLDAPFQRRYPELKEYCNFTEAEGER